MPEYQAALKALDGQTVTIRGFLTSLGASLVMGLAVTGMHYTGMAAVRVHVHDGTGGSWAGAVRTEQGSRPCS